MDDASVRIEYHTEYHCYKTFPRGKQIKTKGKT